MRRPLLCKLIFLTLISLLIPGCWDRVDIEERLSVVSMGIDKARDGWEISVQVPIPRNIVGGGSGGGGGGGGDPVQVYSGTGKTVVEALNEIARQSDRPLFFGNLQTVLFGEEMARAGISPVLDHFRREPEIRRELWTVVVKGRAKEVLTTETKLQQVPSDFIREMLKHGTRRENIAETTLGKLLIMLATPAKRAPVLNYLEKKDDAFRWIGAAVFRNDRMVGLLMDNEVTPLVQMAEAKQGSQIIAPCPGQPGTIIFRPDGIRRQVKVSGRPAVDINLELEGSIVEKTCNLDLSKPQMLTEIGESLERVYEQKARALIAKSQKDFKADIIQVGRYVRAYQPVAFKKMAWERQYPRIPIRVSYKVNVRRIGMRAQ
ncbi:Ger(x)C family spore germination protein [Lihuaxuella thermophila]|uniref:Spore germination protein KC n=1 Tax=Lihuaxuella thermophila TaxID=1173111 RepID=A0A1H8EA61_9BACL|nr:Ger(x)C family spore germination protein [Lihuaxuella thermophila]SEN16024.1 spore germination protein KC [Lihuaxuella thermophila]